MICIEGGPVAGHAFAVAITVIGSRLGTDPTGGPANGHRRLIGSRRSRERSSSVDWEPVAAREVIGRLLGAVAA
ncbi:hypothetical protein SOM22_12400 [Stenotrophomonas rhizophila]|uniref:hypothetical protein n=1 Tax=Stenotrophomonas rhizophila TaxID=216778 RepID=UPI002A6A1A97|nr:hypothetical protein [Stenotrophomonas rhizophila]MDY0955382.1 hypothetical protein [Stenotrophomonas rhizophila]